MREKNTTTRSAANQSQISRSRDPVAGWRAGMAGVR